MPAIGKVNRRSSRLAGNADMAHLTAWYQRQP